MQTTNILDQQYEIKAFQKIVCVLNCFTEQQPELTLMEIQRMLGIHKSTLYRLLVNLESCGMIGQDSTTGRYRLGIKFLQYAKISVAGMSLVEVARPKAKALAEATQETVIINVVQDDETVCIEKIESPQPLKLYVDLGRSTPLLAGASAKALAAYLPIDRIRAIYQKTGNSGISFEALCDQLAEIRRTGVAHSVAEHDHGIFGIACPIRNGNNEVIADIAILGPAFRLSPEKTIEYTELCKQCAREISRSLGM